MAPTAHVDDEHDEVRVLEGARGLGGDLLVERVDPPGSQPPVSTTSKATPPTRGDGPCGRG